MSSATREPNRLETLACDFDEIHVGHRHSLLIDMNQPTAELRRGGGKIGRNDKSRRDQIERGLKGMLEVQDHAEFERASGFRACHKQRVEHPAALFPVIGKAAEEQTCTLAASRDIDGVRCFRTVNLGDLGSEQNGPPHHRGRVGPGPPASDEMSPGVGLRGAAEP